MPGRIALPPAFFTVESLHGGPVFGGPTIIASTAVPPGCVFMFAPLSAEQEREAAGMTTLERAEYLVRNGKAAMVRFGKEVSHG